MTFKEEFNQIKDDLFNMSQQLYDNPELGDEEYESNEAASKLSSLTSV